MIELFSAPDCKVVRLADIAYPSEGRFCGCPDCGEPAVAIVMSESRNLGSWACERCAKGVPVLIDFCRGKQP